MSEFSIPIRVYYEDTDAGGVVYYANYLRFLERGRTEFMRALGYDLRELARDPGILFVVAGLEIDYGLIKKGHALVWSANLLHGGSPANDPERTRKSQVTHYFFEGTRYYTPLMSKDLTTEEGIFWRDPEWIPH